MTKKKTMLSLTDILKSIENIRSTAKATVKKVEVDPDLAKEIESLRAELTAKNVPFTEGRPPSGLHKLPPFPFDLLTPLYPTLSPLTMFNKMPSCRSASGQ